MFGKRVKTLVLAAVIGIGSLAATSGQAAAGNVDFWIGIGPGWGTHYGPPRRHSVCKPRRAVKKAVNLGVRDVRVVRRNAKRVVVKGWRRGYPVRVVFANRRHCPVIALR